MSGYEMEELILFSPILAGDEHPQQLWHYFHAASARLLHLSAAQHLGLLAIQQHLSELQPALGRVHCKDSEQLSVLSVLLPANVQHHWLQH